MNKVKWLVIILITASLLIGTAAVFAQYQVRTQATTSTPLNADVLFAKVNAERTQRGLKPLVRDARLDASAQAKVDDMVINNYKDHVNPTTGKHGYDYVPTGMCAQVGENYVYVDEVGEKNTDALKWWKSSKPHYDAILNTQVTLTGIAVNGNIAVQHFCIQ